VKYLSHSPTENSPEGQKLKEHLENTAQLAETFSCAIGEKDGRLCGLYHDIGKYSMAFQRRLAGSKETVDHSTAGALLMFERRNVPTAMCIAGHHAGLADLGTKNDLSDTFMGRINRAKAGALEDCSAWRSELPDCIPSGCENRPGIGNNFLHENVILCVDGCGLAGYGSLLSQSTCRDKMHRLGCSERKAG